MTIKENYNQIMSQINEACQRSNRQEDEITVVAVTKYVSIETANQAIKAGIQDLGENRLEGFKEKFEVIGKQATWHFIGTLQSRKVKEIIDDVDYIHSLDRKSLAKEINKRSNRKIPCFIQVNTSGEESKHGLQPEQVNDFIKLLGDYENIEVVGLMTMAPLTEEQDVVRNCFKSLRNLRDQIQEMNLNHAPCHYLSMGMSQDFEVAIEEGATHLRIGTSLVGKELQ
ncbi:YggS family pyridoxal phosphate-dependent enzyme [Filobacillus milosensis]|uniref:Pyridoxal phosphate homeostasis protein n=1 Tax=Filobacillus milosensis TaxID=94137 RepID=A0A4Y8IP19_9BACI|nr:YggS family pyridoxal phosphate-dependent enzyme [Filobacillus milosensis]TFB23285.1 YggS family pyridoxal phosphate-dependent enzyme [Filobacillus milosensis]